MIHRVIMKPLKVALFFLTLSVCGLAQAAPPRASHEVIQEIARRSGAHPLEVREKLVEHLRSTAGAKFSRSSLERIGRGLELNTKLETELAGHLALPLFSEAFKVAPESALAASQVSSRTGKYLLKAFGEELVSSEILSTLRSVKLKRKANPKSIDPAASTVVAISPDATLVASVGQRVESDAPGLPIELHSAGNGGSVLEILDLDASNTSHSSHKSSEVRLRFSSDSKLLAVHTASETRVYHASTGKRVTEFGTQIGETAAAMVDSFASSREPISNLLVSLPSQDGRIIAQGLRSRRVLIVDARTNIRIAAADLGFQPTSLGFSPHDGMVAAGSRNHDEVAIVDTRTGKVLARLPGHEGGITSVVHSRDGRFVLAATTRGALRIWDRSGGVKGRSKVALAYELKVTGNRLEVLSSEARDYLVAQSRVTGRLELIDLSTFLGQLK